MFGLFHFCQTRASYMVHKDFTLHLLYGGKYLGIFRALLCCLQVCRQSMTSHLHEEASLLPKRQCVTHLTLDLQCGGPQNPMSTKAPRPHQVKQLRVWFSSSRV